MCSNRKKAVNNRYRVRAEERNPPEAPFVDGAALHETERKVYNNSMRKNLMRAAVCAASIALLFGITACKQFTADIEEELGYWAAEVI